MILAVFGDIHGNLEDMYGLCRRWERTVSQKISHVLQCGDLGAFPDPSVADRATRRHAERDPTELGAADYLVGKKTASHPTTFVAGNHEDFAFLKAHENGPVDPAGMIFYLPTGFIRELTGEDGTIRIAGFGGTSPRTKKPKKLAEGMGKKYHDVSHLAPLLAVGAQVDILLTHDGPAGSELEAKYGPGAGSPEVAKLIEKLKPRLAFFGHYRRPPSPFTRGRTIVVPANNADGVNVKGRDGAMIIVDTKDWAFRFVMKDFETGGTDINAEKQSR